MSVGNEPYSDPWIQIYFLRIYILKFWTLWIQVGSGSSLEKMDLDGVLNYYPDPDPFIRFYNSIII